MSRVVVLSPAPTANGDLHLGHLAGPFLAADIYARYARSQGTEVLLGTGVQDTPTFVVTTADRLGLEPSELVARSTGEIEATLAAMDISVDGFTGGEERFTKWVIRFMDRLHATGALRVLPTSLPYAPRTGEFLVDGYVRGGCPTCLAESCAGVCESCGHPVPAGELIDAHSTLRPDDPVELREVPILVLPMEGYRRRLRDYFDATQPRVRPHALQAVQEMLGRPLPDLPITSPISWGIPAPFPEVAGQVFNANAETMAWSQYATTLAAERLGAVVAGEDELWLPDSDATVVYFLGFDNIYPFAVAGLAMLMAFGDRYRLPAAFVANELYELDNQKFSTSRGHVVWGRDLLAQVPRDLVRFHLAATSPEFQRMDFSHAALARLTESRLVGPWNRVAAIIDEWVGRGSLPVSPRSQAMGRRIMQRFAAAYELDQFSISRAAETLTEQLSRLERRRPTTADAGDLCHEVDVVLNSAAPILPDLAKAGLPGSTSTDVLCATSEVTARRLPRLTNVKL